MHVYAGEIAEMHVNACECTYGHVNAVQEVARSMKSGLTSLPRQTAQRRQLLTLVRWRVICYPRSWLRGADRR